MRLHRYIVASEVPKENLVVLLLHPEVESLCRNISTTSDEHRVAFLSIANLDTQVVDGRLDNAVGSSKLSNPNTTIRATAEAIDLELLGTV